MKKIIPLILGSLLFLGANACSQNPEASDTDGGVRSDQRESDARAREQRDSLTTMVEGEQPLSGDLAVDVRNLLESNLPDSRLAVNVDVEAKTATVTGTVKSQEQFDRIQPLAMEVEGIELVNNNTEIKPD
ncbi:BON domain-containing protein [Phormidium sp. FACHB-1136]|uniref:BON domain-containing protein n=1 Tax=Phormidium sp. FACHB-1136 TaxID=2692848 RepID=UPI001683462A|nr:BON domain-containing protein [Phormidium sp. FACHB-1136]MBD2426413.1 BON domain-containing protein [Phormidium sp. FACHB-1136]